MLTTPAPPQLYESSLAYSGSSEHKLLQAALSATPSFEVSLPHKHKPSVYNTSTNSHYQMKNLQSHNLTFCSISLILLINRALGLYISVDFPGLPDYCQTELTFHNGHPPNSPALNQSLWGAFILYDDVNDRYNFNSTSAVINYNCEVQVNADS